MARCRYKSLLKGVERIEKALLERDRLKALLETKKVKKILEKEVKKMEEKGVNPEIPELLSWAYRRYEEETGNPYAKDWGRDGKLLGEILEQLKDHSKKTGIKESEIFKSLWEIFINKYTRKRAKGFPYFKTELQKLYEWWRKEVESPIDFGTGAVNTEPVDHNKYYDGEF
jgi:hypothetical protein